MSAQQAWARAQQNALAAQQHIAVLRAELAVTPCSERADHLAALIRYGEAVAFLVNLGCPVPVADGLVRFDRMVLPTQILDPETP